MKLRTLILIPFSACYALVLRARHLFYDWGLLKSEKGKVPSIVVGNLDLGGTGKTPHALLFANHIRKNHEVAIVSRGYGRKTKGFREVTLNATAADCGDEPVSMKRHSPDLPIFVGEKRVHAIANAVNQIEDLEWVVLDDAFQHRALKGDIHILLTQFSKPFFENHLLPAGTLRDLKSRWKIADFIVVTKAPSGVKETDILKWLSKFPELTRKPIFFSSLVYDRPVHLFTGKTLDSKDVLVYGLSGLADNQPFETYLKESFTLKKYKSYPDHYNFTSSDIKTLGNEFGTFAGPEEIIVMTEKDAAKWRDIPEARNLPLYYIPISLQISEDSGKSWDKVLDELMKKVKR